jgi:hypothetical protein
MDRRRACCRVLLIPRLPDEPVEPRKLAIRRPAIDARHAEVLLDDREAVSRLDPIREPSPDDGAQRCRGAQVMLCAKAPDASAERVDSGGIDGHSPRRSEAVLVLKLPRRAFEGIEARAVDVEAVSKDFGSFLGQTGLDGFWNCGAVGRLARMKRIAVAGGSSTQWRRRVIL